MATQERQVGTSPTRKASAGAGSSWFLALLAAVTTALFIATIYATFFVASTEAQMGIVQKIFYFHVPSAYAMYVGFVVSAVASGMYLAKRSAKWDALAIAGAEVGLLFCLIVLITGPLWARKAWGVWWTWDPRLSTTLVAGLIYLTVVALRSFGEAGAVEKRFAAGLAVLGFLNLPIIHYSVKRWRGQHPSVISGKGGGLETDMYIALTLSFAAFTALVVWLLIVRARVERSRLAAQDLEIRLIEVSA